MPRASSYPAHIISMIYNPLSAQEETEGLSDTDVFPFTVPAKLACDREFIKALNSIRAKKVAIYYPDNFYLHLTENVLRTKKMIGHPEVVPLPKIRTLLRRTDTRLIAWCWYYIVQWVFFTDTMLDHCSGTFTESEGLLLEGHRGKRVPVSVGMTFECGVEGMFLSENNAIQVLFNPLYVGKKWLLADIIDLAVHECTHALVREHNEDFVLIESQLRRELRRIVDEESILEDAKDVLSAFDD